MEIARRTSWSIALLAAGSLASTSGCYLSHQRDTTPPHDASDAGVTTHDAGAGDIDGGTVTPDAATLGPVLDIGAGQHLVCALLVSGVVSCWDAIRPTPPYVAAPVPGLSDIVALSVDNNGGDLGCEVSRSGAVLCGFLPDAPTVVAGISSAIDVEVGPYHTCAVLADHTASCWGQNDYGELGDGTQVAHLAPAPVVDLVDVAELAIGVGFTCARTTAGTVACWGTSTEGTLGDGHGSGDGEPPALRPRFVPGIADAVRIGAFIGIACVVRATGDVLCWGDADGRLGRGTPMTVAEAATPGPVDGVHHALALAFAAGGFEAFGDPACAAGDDGVSCWGAMAPLVRFYSSPASAVALNSGLACVIDADDHVLCAGASGAPFLPVRF